MDFTPFPKMARWSRDVVVTEKIDGTNAQVHIRPATDGSSFEFGLDCQIEVEGLQAYVRAGSRTRWIKIGDDNFGFAGWVHEHAHALAGLGFGQHFGEWWGRGIPRNYGLAEKRFSLFNVGRWYDPRDCANEEIGERFEVPECCSVVPILAQGPNAPGLAEACIAQLREHGSYAAPGFMDPEGIVIFHTAAQVGFKKTVLKDESPKGAAA